MLFYNMANLIFFGFPLAIKPVFSRIILIAVPVLAVIALAFTAYILLIRKRLQVRKAQNKLPDYLKLSSKDYYSRPSRLPFSRTTKSIKLEDLNKDLEPFGFAYYPRQDMFYSIMNGWQRKYGYCELYDEGAATFSMIIDCEPIRFDYAGKRWLIELWKGQYGMNSGCEIGVYSTTGPNLNIPNFFDGTFYFSAKDEDHLPLGFSLIKDGNVIFTRREVHWWLTGFRLGEFSDPSELIMNAEITLKDEGMRDAFVKGLRKTGYSDNEFSILGNTVRIMFDKPHSPQPLTRTPIIERYMQANNQRNCQAYRFATKNFYNPLDKMELVKMQAPKMYTKILNVGNTKELFSSYNIIQKFLDRPDDDSKDD